MDDIFELITSIVLSVVARIAEVFYIFGPLPDRRKHSAYRVFWNWGRLEFWLSVFLFGGLIVYLAYFVS